MAPKKAVKKAGNTNAGSNKKPSKPTTAVKSKKNDPTVKKKDKKQIKEFIHVPQHDGDDDIVVSDEDLDFFNENEGMAGFLTGLDSTAIARNITKRSKKEARKKERKLAPKKQQVIASESSSEEFDTEDELDNFEEDDEAGLVSSDEEEDVDSGLLSSGEEVEEEDKYNDDSDDEMDYETKPRKVAEEWTKKDYHTKLPIKLPGGKIHQVEEKPIDDEEEEEEEEQVAEEIEQVEEEEESEEEEDEKKPRVSKKLYLIQKKEQLAEIAGNLQENPEENIDQLRSLRTIYKDDNVIIKKLALLTQLAVYKDIIPGYRIRPLTEAETGVKVTKEVRQMREYEKTLLSNYEQFLKDLNIVLKKKGNDENDESSLATVATRCLCELLTTQTHFNFRLEIMVTVVTRMSTIKWNPLAAMCQNAIITIFQNDESGKISLDAVKMIIRMVKSKGFAISEHVIQTFMHLRLRDEMAHSRRGDDEKVGQKRKNRDKTFINKKARKALRETKEIEKEFREADAIVSKEEKDKHQTETLKLIFAFYFRILKKQTSSPLLPSVLEGLSKFAHLISIDFFHDLLNALRDVMHIFEDSNDISRNSSGTRKRLLCITTAFQLLSGQGEAFNYDLKDFYKEIYTILFKATYHTKVEEKPDSQFDTESDMLIKGLELMFLRKRQVPLDRLAAFIKRFTMVALNMPNKTVLRCVGLLQKLVQKDNRLDALLQSEDRAASGIYLPLLEDPELCNPFGTSLYELFLLQNHYDPNVRSMATNLQKTTQE